MTFIRSFVSEECGASLVEYAVALIVVTIIGGAAMIGLGGAAGRLAINADTVVSTACSQGAAVASSTPGVANTSC